MLAVFSSHQDLLSELFTMRPLLTSAVPISDNLRIKNACGKYLLSIDIVAGKYKTSHSEAKK